MKHGWLVLRCNNNNIQYTDIQCTGIIVINEFILF
jgi:hypothetical protein